MYRHLLKIFIFVSALTTAAGAHAKDWTPEEVRENPYAFLEDMKNTGANDTETIDLLLRDAWPYLHTMRSVVPILNQLVRAEPDEEARIRNQVFEFVFTDEFFNEHRVFSDEPAIYWWLKQSDNEDFVRQVNTSIGGYINLYDSTKAAAGGMYTGHQSSSPSRAAKARLSGAATAAKYVELELEKNGDDRDLLVENFVRMLSVGVSPDGTPVLPMPKHAFLAMQGMLYLHRSNEDPRLQAAVAGLLAPLHRQFLGFGADFFDILPGDQREALKDLYLFGLEVLLGQPVRREYAGSLLGGGRLLQVTANGDSSDQQVSFRTGWHQNEGQPRLPLFVVSLPKVLKGELDNKFAGLSHIPIDFMPVQRIWPEKFHGHAWVRNAGENDFVLNSPGDVRAIRDPRLMGADASLMIVTDLLGRTGFSDRESMDGMTTTIDSRSAAKLTWTNGSMSCNQLFIQVGKKTRPE